MQAARAAGWDADCEVSNGSGDQRWIADVLASKGAVKIAIEAQISNVAWSEIALA